MNDTLSRILDKNTPQFNKNVTEGSGKVILKSAPDYLNDIISSTVKTMTSTGLEYHGWRRLSPKEEFNKLFATSDKRIPYDMARSDLYMLELRFTYQGNPISRYLYLPYADRGNIIKISDTSYHIVPVLSDTVISPNHKEVFVRLLKDKLTFSRFNRNFIVDGERVPGQIIYSNTYRLAGRQIQDNLGSAHPPISVYLLGEIGLREAFYKYAGISNILIIRGDTSDYNLAYKIYESTKIKPRGLKEFNYRGHDIKILIPKESITDDNSSFIDNFVFGIMYMLDILPESETDLMDILNNHDVVNEKIFWRIILGRIVFKNGYSIDKIMSDMTDHFNTLQNYMDTLIKDKLKEVGVNVDTFFDLIAIMLKNYNTWLLNSKEHNSSVYNRYIDILYYILYDIIYGLNRGLFDIAKKSSKKVLSEKEVVTIFANNITTKKIYSIVKSQSMNIALNLCDYPGDIMYSKITSILEDQSRGNGVKRGKSSQFPESTRTLKGQDLAIGSLLFLAKNAPSPRFRSNLFMNYDLRTGRLLIDDKMRKKIEKLDILLLGKTPYNKRIEESEQSVTLDQLD